MIVIHALNSNADCQGGPLGRAGRRCAEGQCSALQPGESIAAFERHGVRYLVIGGLAATLHGSPVMTTDDQSQTWISPGLT
jgi:hypothetical protein